MLGKAIGSMEGAFNMNELEVEHEDAHDLVVHASRWLDVGILQHTFDVTCIDFNDQIPDA